MSLTLNACMPLKTVKPIESYALIKAKTRSRKPFKKHTRYRFGNSRNANVFYKFLKTKYDVFEHQNSFLITTKIEAIDHRIYEMQIYLISDRDTYIWLPNLKKKDKNDPFYNEEKDAAIQHGDDEFFIDIIVLDNANTDCLSAESLIKNKVIAYLNALRLEYNAYKKNPFL